jgi:hypothetical protein
MHDLTEFWLTLQAFDGDVYYHGGFNLMIDINLRIDLPIGGVSVEVPIRASVVVKAFAGRVHTSHHYDLGQEC